MSDELVELTERWVLTFCETPPVLDAELMRGVLAELGAGNTGREHQTDDAENPEGG